MRGLHCGVTSADQTLEGPDGQCVGMEGSDAIHGDWLALVDSGNARSAGLLQRVHLSLMGHPSSLYLL
jgi:hypothetical protein